jgi:O-antigen/teichoic acid export membrane protein
MIDRLIKNTSALIISGLVDKASYGVLFIIFARKLTKTEFGIYNLFLALIFIGGMIVTFGMGNVIIREVAKNRNKTQEFFNNATFLALILSLLSWPLVIGLAILLKYDSQIVFMLSFGGAMFIFMGFSQIASSVIKAHEQMEIFAAVTGCISIISLALNVLVLLLWRSVTWLVVVLFITEGLKAIVFAFIVRGRYVIFTWELDRKVIYQIISLSIPFALLMAFGVLLHRIDVVMMGYLKPMDEVAVFSMASKFTDALSLISGSLVGALFPALSAKIISSREDLWNIYNDTFSVFALLGFGISLLIIILAKPIILLLFGANYLAGTIALRWLGLAFLFTMISGPAGTFLLAAGDQMSRLLFLVIALVGANIVMNLWLIPKYSYNGAAFTTFFCTMLGFLFRFILSGIYFGKIPNHLKIVWRPLIAGLLMGGLLILLNSLNLPILLLIGGAIYCLTLILLGEFHQARYLTIRLKLSKLFSHA